MTTLPPDVVDVPGTGPLEVHRAWPRGPGHVLLELRSDDVVLAGQWWTDPAELAAAATRYAGTPACVAGEVLVHVGGADHRLPRLQEELGAPGARLLGHRAERRAVVRRADGSFVKHVRPRRVEDVALGMSAAARLVGSVAVVPVVEPVDAGAGTAVLAPVEGSTLLELGRDPATSPATLSAAWRAAGTVAATLHAAHPAGLDRWTAAQEIDSVLRLVRPAVDAGFLPESGWQVLCERRLDLPPVQAVPVHRDLHDQQLLWDGRQMGLIDCDTLSAGDPAGDVANVLAHLELRHAQGLLTSSRAAAATEDFMAGLEPAADLLTRVGVHRALTTLRLAALYAWRPRWRHLVPTLVDRALTGGASL